MLSFELPSPEDDGLLIPEVGEHSLHKHHFLARYIYAFTVAMKKKLWNSLHYVDLFAGAGIVRLKESRDLSWGSPLIAAQAAVPFDALHFCDQDPKKIEALRRRVSRVAPRIRTQVLEGNANEKVEEAFASIPSGALSLAFLDPYGLHLNFETVSILAQMRCDLIIYFPDHVDVLRNWELNYHDNPDSNLDRVLGSGVDWRSIFKNELPSTWVQRLRDAYVKQLQSLGYVSFEYERICAKGLPIYQLIFCSKHQLGADIWRRVAEKKPDGQRTFDFGPSP